MPSDHGERERRSWSEIDKAKDRSSYGRRDNRDFGSENSPYSSQRDITKYKAALEGLFSPEKKAAKKAARGVPKEGAEKLKVLRETSDRQEFQNLANEFIKAHGLPEMWEDLENFLRHKDTAVLAETILRMEQLLQEQSETRIGNFKKDLHLIVMTTRDRDLRKQVTHLLRELGESVA